MRKLLLMSAACLSVAIGWTHSAAAQSQDLADIDSGQNFPMPGQVTIRLNGRLRFYADYMPRANQVNTHLNASNTGSAANGNSTNGTGTNKMEDYTFQTYLRLYPGFDGVAANGLKYGAAAEIRVGAVNALNTDTASLGGAGGGLNGTISAQNNSRNTLYVRRAFGYVGTDKYGTIRMGQTDGPLSLYETGTFENVSDGGWNGDVSFALPSAQWLVWPFSTVGNEYTTLKMVYLSPQFYGFDFGVSFEPNTGSSGIGTGNGNQSCGQAASISCANLAATPTYESQRRRNTSEVLLRYRGAFGPVGIAATVGYMGSSKVADNGTPKRPIQFQGLDLGDGGLTITYKGLTVGGHIMAGTGNNAPLEFALQRKGGQGEFAWLAGASYTIGPVLIGGAYVDVQSEGFNGNLATGVDPTGERREQGVSFGTTYSVAPGFALFATYLWDQRREAGYDLVNNTVGNTNNKVTGEIIGIGSSFAW